MSSAADLAGRRWRLLASAMVSFFAVGMTYFAVPPLAGTAQIDTLELDGVRLDGVRIESGPQP